MHYIYIDHLLFLCADDMIRLFEQMADYLINQPFCSDDFIRSYKNHQKLEKQVINQIV